MLVAEPVGSCTDLSATILQPIKDKFRQQFVLTPLSVLVDPARLREVFDGAPGRLHDSAAYIVRKQMEEADIVVINKSDLLSAGQIQSLRAFVARNLPGAEVHCLSALTGEGVDAWLDAVLTGGLAGRRVVDVDYDTYAEGEAVLGWLNAAIRLECPDGGDWRRFCVDLMECVQAACRQRCAEIGHVKILLSSGGERYVANLTGLDGEVSARGEMSGRRREAQLIVNARVEMSPGDLEAIVRDRLAAAAGADMAVHIIDHLQSLSPGRPNPTHRYGQVVPSCA